MIKVVGWAPNDSKCDCEHAACTVHAPGACISEAWFIIEAFGMKQKLCPHCLRFARRHEKATNAKD